MEIGCNVFSLNVRLMSYICTIAAAPKEDVEEVEEAEVEADTEPVESKEAPVEVMDTSVASETNEASDVNGTESEVKEDILEMNHVIVEDKASTEIFSLCLKLP